MLSLELEPKDIDYEYDVWGAEDGQDAEHYGTFDSHEAAIDYKVELTEAYPRLHLHIQRRRVDELTQLTRQIERRTEEETER